MITTSSDGKVKETIQDSRAGEILQTSATVASIVVALAVLLPQLTNLISLRLGNTQLLLTRPLLLLCGLFALMACIWSLHRISREIGVTVAPTSNLGMLFIALFILALIYIGVVMSI